MIEKPDSLESKVTPQIMSSLEANLIAGTILSGVCLFGKLACAIYPEYILPEWELDALFRDLMYSGVAWNVMAVFLDAATKPKDYGE